MGFGDVTADVPRKYREGAAKVPRKCRESAAKVPRAAAEAIRCTIRCELVGDDGIISVFLVL